MAAKQEVANLNIPANAFEYNGHYYKIYSNVTSTWEESKNYCENLGGNLAVINDAAENTALFNYMKSQGYNSAYFGLSDAAKEGNWVWVDNTPVTYTNWASGEPNSERSNEDYAEFYYKFTDGRWNDGNFNKGTVGDSNTFICEWTPIQKIEIPSDAFEYNGHSYYLYSEVTNTWEQAQQYCQNLGGHLAIINDATENIALFNYMKSQGYDSAYFGLSDVAKEGEWIWSDGTSLTYKNWASGEPNGNQYENYGMFYYKFTDGKWNDGNFNKGSSKSDTNTFICEWDSVQEKETAEPYWTLEDLETLIDAFNIFKPLPKVKDILDITAKVSNIINTVNEFSKGNKTSEDIQGAVLKVAGDITGVVGDVKSLKNKDDLFWSLNASALACAGSWIATTKIDTTKLPEKDKEKIDEAIKATNDLALEAAGAAISAIGKHSGLSAAEINYLSNKLKVRLNGPLSLLMVAYSGYTQFNESVEKYSEEELPFWMLAGETLVDVITAGIYGGAHQFTLGLDDLAFKGLRWIGAKIMGKEPTLTDKNYMEWIAEGIKCLMLGSTSNDDIIEIQKDKKEFNAQAGNDYVKNAFSKVKIYGNEGNDSISNFENTTQNFVSGGKGNDRIISSSTSSTIKGDEGEDKIVILADKNTVEGGSEKDWIICDAGNNIIYGGTGNDTIAVFGSKNEVRAEDDDDIIILTDDATNNTLYGGKGNDVIYLSDSKKNLIAYYEGDGNDIIWGYNSDDTIRVPEKHTYRTMGNDIIISVGTESVILKNAKGITPNIVNQRNFDNIELPDFLTLNKKKLLITAGTNFTGNTIDLNLYSVGANNITAANLKSAIEIIGNDENNSIKGSRYSDTISGGAGNDTVSLGGGADTYVYSSGNDLIQDYTAGADKIKISTGSISSASLSSSNVILNVSNGGKISVKGGKGKEITIIDSSGNETSNIYPLDTLPAGISIKNSVLTAAKTFTGKKIDLADYPATKVNAAALSQAVTIVGTSAANSIKGGKGADTISGSAGNDTVSLGGGADVYVYSSGNDLIQDYKVEDKIKLSTGSISSASLSSSNVILNISNGGKISVKGGKGKEITIIDSNGKETSNIYPLDTLPAGISVKSSNLTVSSSFEGGTIDLANYAAVKKVNASAATNDIYIIGNSNNNSLKGGKGTSSLWGGASTADDTLIGGSGKNIFGYGMNEGNDIIKNAKNTDLVVLHNINLSDLTTANEVNGKLVLATSTGSLTINDKKVSPTIMLADQSLWQYSYSTKSWSQK